MNDVDYDSKRFEGSGFEILEETLLVPKRQSITKESLFKQEQPTNSKKIDNKFKRMLVNLLSEDIERAASVDSIRESTRIEGGGGLPKERTSINL